MLDDIGQALFGDMNAELDAMMIEFERSTSLDWEGSELGVAHAAIKQELHTQLMAALTGGTAAAPLTVNGYSDNPALDAMPASPVGPTLSESILSGWEYEYNKAWSASGGKYDPFNDALARKTFAGNREYIKWLDRVADAQLAQDFRDFGSIYYQTASTLIAPIGMVDTAYQILNGDMSAAEAAVAVATMGKGRAIGSAERLGANGAERAFQGGAYGRLSAGPGIERHHLPADSVTPFTRYSGPAIQMDRADHLLTSSHGSRGLEGALYRSEIKQLIEGGRMRDAMAIEIRDVRRTAVQGGGSITKYNPAIREMLDYTYQKNWLTKK
ncbi:MAG TPA: hypothetical protein VFO12_00475 [Sphingomicrobium sp.]|nr:hypothetical protein [Sphingomicrobium sp.]